MLVQYYETLKYEKAEFFGIVAQQYVYCLVVYPRYKYDLNLEL